MIFTKTRSVKTPSRGTKGSAGIDFYVPDDFPATEIPTGGDVLIPSGIKVIVPYGYSLIFFNKSGRATKGKIQVGACVIDSDYRGEIHLHIFNWGPIAFNIVPGEKLLQGVLIPTEMADPREVSPKSYQEIYENEKNYRGEDGFGSTGLS